MKNMENMEELEFALHRLEEINNKNQPKQQPKIIYSDQHWQIEILNDNEFNPIIKVSSFKNGHFVDDLELSRQMFEDSQMVDEIKAICYV